ncbi:CpsD/CapB family tyrosine-protein kinase [uncultured Roseobacter sp.]|uniref:CpsD/CapB family tyrosine-protein kinase n=1 Tax=uncultured Roseobacter sp. TaxID=114847 RepID=UPI00261890C4|nr:CpsD/CapB family tyrosine-protein kinase [uncultured Roseobacter sp.]
MEKLQTAIEKARQKRAGSKEQEPATPRPAARKPAGGGSAPDSLWDSIPLCQPSEALLEKNRIVTLKAGKAATPFDILRTKILLQMRQNNWTRLAITSATPGSGKTTIACNLALGLGRQKDLRAMLFDLDLRRPHASRTLGLNNPHNLSDVLTGGVSFEEQAMRVGSNVILSLTNQAASDPTTILLGDETQARLDEIQDRYKPDLMIFDLPPVLVSDDTRAFLNNVDCALIVARANQTRYGQFDAAEHEIAEHTNVLGVVLNGSGAVGDDEMSYGGYGYE